MDEKFTFNHDEFYKNNANTEFIANQLSSLIINILRAISSDKHYQIPRGTGDIFEIILILLKKIDGNINYNDILSLSVATLRKTADENGRGDPSLDTARLGLRYLAELSCSDNAAQGRASSRYKNFLMSINKLHN